MHTFRVMGKPVTQGSITAIPVKRKSGRIGAVAIHNHSDALYSQRIAIQHEYTASSGQLYTDSPIEIDMTFAFVRPKSVSVKKRPYHTVKPDVDKLVRAVLDALTNVAYRDDSQVVRINANKIYDESEYIEVTVREFTE